MSRLLWIPVGAVSAFVLSLFGCGGVNGADGLFDSGSSGAGGAPGTTSATGATSAATTGATTSSATSSASATTGASSTSASSTSASSSSAASSSSTGGGIETVSCGDVTCPIGTESACCWSRFATPSSGACVQGSPDNDGCKTFLANDGYETRIECQTSAQCDQGVCCGQRTGFFQGGQQKFFYEILSCVDACPSKDVTICDPTNPADVCPKIATQNGPVQGVCKASTLLPSGYFACGAP